MKSRGQQYYTYEFIERAFELPGAILAVTDDPSRGMLSFVLDAGPECPEGMYVANLGLPVPEKLMTQNIPVRLELLQDILDPDECSFDHHGGCQTHGFYSLEQGDICPNEQLRRLIEKYSQQ